MPSSSRVLLVEDTPSLSALYKEYLRDLEIALTHAPTGSVAVDLLSKQEFDLLLLDLNLPDIPGLQILRKMQDMNKIVPTIIISANNTVEKAVEAMKFGARDYIVKPFSRDRLNITVKNMLLMIQMEKEHHKLKSLTAG